MLINVTILPTDYWWNKTSWMELVRSIQKFSRELKRKGSEEDKSQPHGSEIWPLWELRTQPCTDVLCDAVAFFQFLSANCGQVPLWQTSWEQLNVAAL
jgi:hypothetical protein